jgi:hypothetical protein
MNRRVIVVRRPRGAGVTSSATKPQSAYRACDQSAVSNRWLKSGSLT